jgi:serine protease Do
MKLVKILGLALVIIGFVTVAAMLAPRVLGQGRTIVRVPDSPALAQLYIGGGGYIGISIRDVEKADVEREKLAGQSGAVIEEVRSGSPAEKAGLKSGDVVIEYDGERVRSAQQLTRLVRETPESRTVKASVMRAGKRVDVEVTPSAGGGSYASANLGRDLEHLSHDLSLRIQPELDRLRELRVEPFAFEFGGRIQTGRLGISAQDLTPQLANYFGVKEGVLVTSVTEASVASKAGLKAGDVITAIDGSVVNRVSDVRRRVERLDEGEDFTIAIARDRKTLTLNGKMASDERPSVRRRALRSL